MVGSRASHESASGMNRSVPSLALIADRVDLHDFCDANGGELDASRATREVLTMVGALSASSS